MTGRRFAGLAGTMMIMLALVSSASADTAHKKAIPPQNTSRGTQQMKGGDGVFGTVYTLNDNWTNFEILSARYSVDPFTSYNQTIAKQDEKFLLLTVAIKNSGTTDNGFNPEGNTFTAVDDAGQDHQGWDYRQASRPGDNFYPTLKPGQGLGQNPAADELTVCITVPAKAKIQKIIFNRGRKAVAGEQVIRYFVAGMDNGNPKNAIQPLPAYVRDPKDPSGAVCAEPGTATVGGPFVPSEYYGYRVDSVASSADATLDGNKAEDGKRFVVATVTVKNLTSKDHGMFDVYNGGQVPYILDTDGEKYPFQSGLRKAKRDEQVDSDRQIHSGEEYAVRYFFSLPKDAKPKSLVIGVDGGHTYAVDLSSAAIASLR